MTSSWIQSDWPGNSLSWGQFSVYPLPDHLSWHVPKLTASAPAVHFLQEVSPPPSSVLGEQDMGRRAHRSHLLPGGSPGNREHLPSQSRSSENYPLGGNRAMTFPFISKYSAGHEAVGQDQQTGHAGSCSQGGKLEGDTKRVRN